MLKYSSIFTIILISFLSIDYVVLKTSKDLEDISNGPVNHAIPEWDLLIFTQQWPITVCKEWKDRDPDHKCSMPSNPDTWTVHGIWPTKLHTRGPEFCNRTWHFDPKQVQPIETELSSKWTNIESGTPLYAFWAHEWTKHGTCAAVLEPLNSEVKYFTKGLDWLDEYSMDRVLGPNIVPSDSRTYSVADFYHVIVSYLGVNPVIECKKENGKNWLSEIRLCFNKNLTLVDCDGVLIKQSQTTLYLNNFYTKVLTSCDVKAPVYYQKTVMTEESSNKDLRHLYVPLYMLLNWIQWFTL